MRVSTRDSTICTEGIFFLSSYFTYTHDHHRFSVYFFVQKTKYFEETKGLVSVWFNIKRRWWSCAQTTDARSVNHLHWTARPEINSQSQISRYGLSIFCLPHRPEFTDFFDLCLHWVSVVREAYHRSSIIFQKSVYLIKDFSQVG